MSKPLYELAAEHRALLERALDAGTVDETTGEVIPAPDFAVDLALSQMDLNAKVKVRMAICAELTHRATALSDESARLYQRAAALKKAADRLRDDTARTLHDLGVKTVEAGTFRVTVCVGPEKVVVEDETKVPEEFQRVKVEADIAGAKAMLKETGTLPAGFGVAPGAVYIRIK